MSRFICLLFTQFVKLKLWTIFWDISLKRWWQKHEPKLLRSRVRWMVIVVVAMEITLIMWRIIMWLMRLKNNKIIMVVTWNKNWRMTLIITITLGYNHKLKWMSMLRFSQKMKWIKFWFRKIMRLKQKLVSNLKLMYT